MMNASNLTAFSFFKNQNLPPSFALSSTGFNYAQHQCTLLKQENPDLYPFRKLQKLGIGSFGTAFKAKCLSKFPPCHNVLLESNETFVIKEIDQEDANDQLTEARLL